MDSKEDIEGIQKWLDAHDVADKTDKPFYHAYGRFMIAWADAENELYRVLCAYAKVSDEIARAIFSGARAKTMMDFIRAIAHNTKMDKDRISDLEYVFNQIGVINTMRDYLAHYATLFYSYEVENPAERIFSNQQRVSRIGNERIHSIGVDTIKKMTADLFKIQNHLNMHYGRSGPFQEWNENFPDAPGQWLYKSLQPVVTRAKNRNAPRRS